VLNAEDRARFEQMLQHLDAARNLAVWMLSNRTDAEDVTQDGMLRAFRFFEGFLGGDVRAWLRQIVRNPCYTWLKKNRRIKMTEQFDEEVHKQSSAARESITIAGDDHERLTQALQVSRSAVLLMKKMVAWLAKMDLGRSQSNSPHGWASVQESRRQESRTKTRFECRCLDCRNRLPSRLLSPFVGSSSSVGAKSAAEQPDIGRSKTRGPSVGRKTGSATRI
jgi:RNA polymerase sigma factor (sigma-70 family)